MRKRIAFAIPIMSLIVVTFWQMGMSAKAEDAAVIGARLKLDASQVGHGRSRLHVAPSAVRELPPPSTLAKHTEHAVTSNPYLPIKAVEPVW